MPRRDSGITVVSHDPLGIPTYDAGNHTPTSLWDALLENPQIHSRLIEGFREFARGRTSIELHEALEDRDVPYWLQPGIEDIARGNKRTAIEVTTETLRRFGNGTTSLDGLYDTLSLLEALEETEQVTEPPAIAVTIDEAFRDRPRRQREAILQLVVHLSYGVDVRLQASPVDRAWLAATHRADLPGVSDWAPTHQGTVVSDELLNDAIAAIDPESRAAKILEQLADEPSETLSYSALDARHSVSRSRIKQVLSTLADLSLVDRFGKQQERHVELLAAGREVVAALRSRYGQQATLSEAVSDVGNAAEQAVFTAQAREGGDPNQHPTEGSHRRSDPDDDPAAEGGVGPYRTRYADRGLATAAFAIGDSQQVTVLEEPSAAREATPEGRTKYVAVDPARDECLVSVRASGGFQYMTSLATALASPKFIENVFTDDRLESIEQPPAILRAARCIGQLSTKALNDPATLREDFIEWGNELQTMTGKMQREEYDDRDRYRGAILRTAHGLAGSIVHLLDVVDFELVRDIRIPNQIDGSSRASLAKSLGISASIQSGYGEFASYRQLFRTDAGPPEFSPTVDAADPTAHCIGGYIIRGTGKRFQEFLEAMKARFQQPTELRETPEEFVIHIPIRHAGRREYGAAVGRLLSRKNLQPDRDTVSLLHTISPHPFAVCQALLRALASEAVPETFRPDEARRALALLDRKHVFPELPRSVGKLTQALLRAEDRQTTSQLAASAGVSKKTARRHLPRLAALGLVDEDSSGWRLQVSSPATSERREWVLPSHLNNEFAMVAGDLLAAVLPPDRYADPGDPVAGMLFGPPDPWPVIESTHRFAPWVGVAGRLAGLEQPDAARVSTIHVGPSIKQTPLMEAV